jgi:hypothetical protein
MGSVRGWSAALAIAIGFGLAMPQGAQAANIPVTNLDDAGAGSLRAAMTAANGSGADDTITFTVTG